MCWQNGPAVELLENVSRLLVEADLNVGPLFEADRFNEADLAFVKGEDHGRGANPFTEKAHAFKQVAVGDAGACEDHLFSRGQVFGVVDSLSIGNAHFGKAFLILRLADHQAREDLAV